MEKPHSLYTHSSLSAFKFSTHQQTPSFTASFAPQSSVKPNSGTNHTGKTSSTYKSSSSSLFKAFSTTLKNYTFSWFLGSLLTIYISKLDLGASTTLYRFSLNTSTPSPWKLCSTDHEVSSFQVWEHKKSTLTLRLKKKTMYSIEVFFLTCATKVAPN